MYKTTQTFVLMLSLLLVGCGGGGMCLQNYRKLLVFRILRSCYYIRRLRNYVYIPITASISGDTITITDVSGTQYSGSVTGNTFTARGVQQLGDVAPGVRCGDITLTYTGTINGDQITGSSEGASPCDAGTVRTTTTQKGTFTVSV